MSSCPSTTQVGPAQCSCLLSSPWREYHRTSLRLRFSRNTDANYPILNPGSVHFDQLKKVKKPFQILTGGYQIIFKNGKWSQIFGSESKKKRFAKEDRRGHRSEQRKRRQLKRASEKEIAQAQRRG